jgi:hypothetical protein
LATLGSAVIGLAALRLVATGSDCGWVACVDVEDKPFCSAAGRVGAVGVRVGSAVVVSARIAADVTASDVEVSEMIGMRSGWVHGAIAGAMASGETTEGAMALGAGTKASGTGGTGTGAGAAGTGAGAAGTVAGAAGGVWVTMSDPAGTGG